MADLVPSSEIEEIVGTYRRAFVHVARAVSSDQRVYILHPRECLRRRPDLRQCPLSVALDRGVEWSQWEDCLDSPHVAFIIDGRLVPDCEAGCLELEGEGL